MGWQSSKYRFRSLVIHFLQCNHMEITNLLQKMPSLAFRAWQAQNLCYPLFRNMMSNKKKLLILLYILLYNWRSQTTWFPCSSYYNTGANLSYYIICMATQQHICAKFSLYTKYGILSWYSTKNSYYTGKNSHYAFFSYYNMCGNFSHYTVWHKRKE